jgi:hypothetical protein
MTINQSTALTEPAPTATPPMRPSDAAALAATELGIFNGPAFALTLRVAKMFSESTLIPKHYQGNPANCMIALNMAQRIGADPLMVAQNLYVVHGTPGWSAQFLIACFNKCGRFSALRYEFQGKEGEDSWGCRAVATELATNEKLLGPLITISLAKKEKWYEKDGSKWKTMPEQMLRYRSAAWFVRAYAPEIAMGLHTSDEIFDAQPNEFGVYETTIETEPPSAPLPTADEIIAELAAKYGLTDQDEIGLLNRFVRETAQVQKRSADVIAAGCLEHYESFTQAFTPWFKKEAAAAKPKKKTKAAEPDEPVSAPAPEPAQPGPESQASPAPPAAKHIIPATQAALDKELGRLGTPGHLPSHLAERFGTGDPSELDEILAQECLKFLRAMN